MPSRNPLSDKDCRDIVDRYQTLRPGDSVARMARDYHRTKARIYQILKDAGVSIRSSVDRALHFRDSTARESAKIFGEKLRNLRLAMRKNQLEFGELCGIAPAVISHMEAKSTSPRYETIYRVIYRTQVEASYFFPMEPTPDFLRSEAFSGLSSNPLRQVVRRVDEIDPESREMVVYDRLSCGHRVKVTHSGRTKRWQVCRECPPEVEVEAEVEVGLEAEMGAGDFPEHCGATCRTRYCPECGQEMNLVQSQERETLPCRS